LKSATQLVPGFKKNVLPRLWPDKASQIGQMRFHKSWKSRIHHPCSPARDSVRSLVASEYSLKTDTRMSTPLTHEQALLREVVSDIAHEAAAQLVAEENDDDDDDSGINTNSAGLQDTGDEAGEEGGEVADLSEEQKRALTQRRKARLSRASNTTQKRKKRNMGYSLMVLAGALAVSYILPKIFTGLSGGASGDSTGFESRVKRFPVCREGTVVITDAAYGHARQTALLLADQGLHVLAGVRTKAEERSFAHDARKGLEPIRLDMAQPNDIAKLYYRLSFVAAELQRPLYGILVNTADSVLDADKAAADSPPNYRNMDIAFNHTHMRRISENVIDVPVLDDGYNSYVKGPMRVVQAALALFATAHEAFAHRVAVPAAATADTANSQCEGGICPAIAKSVEAPAKEPANSKKRYKSKDDEALCTAGATSRILFMTFDEAVLEPADQSRDREHVASFFMPSTIPKSRRQKKSEYRHNDTTGTTAAAAAAGKRAGVGAQAQASINTAGLSTDLCGAPCAMNAALHSYANQLEGALWDSLISISRMSVGSKPYRSRTKKPSNKESTISREAEEIATRERQWVELTKAEASPGADLDAKSQEFVTRKQRKQAKKLAAQPDPLIIDPKYSKEANYAAHAFLAAFPRQVYDQHQVKPKPRRAKFLGL